MRPRERAWFLPVLLSAGEVPDIPIGSFETIRDLQYVDLHEDWEQGVRRLVEALRPVEAVVDQLLTRASDRSVSGAQRLALLDRAVLLSPRRRDVRQVRAQARIASGEAGKAVDDYEEAAPAYPAERAWCYWLAGDEDSALAVYKRLDRQKAATARDQYDLGCLLYNAARFEEARSAFGAAAESAPGVLAPRLMKLRLWLQDGHPVRIACLAREIEEAFGEHPDVCEARGHAMIFARRSAQFDPEGEAHLAPYDHSFVIEQFSLACRLDSSNPRRFYRVAKVLFDLGDYRNSGAAATSGLRIMPESGSLRVILAQVAEYGPEGVVADQDAAQLYDEAIRAELDDHLDRDDDTPVFDGDERSPRPVLRRYTTVPLKLAGVAWA